MNISQLYYTLKPLKFIQFYYRLYYLLRRIKRKFFQVNYFKNFSVSSINLKLETSIYSLKSLDANSFCFLNKTVSFDKDIDWNYGANGKLWTYNLNYFEFLLEEGCSKKQGLALIKAHIKSFPSLKDGLEPYPLSLKGINWIKFISQHAITDTNIDVALFQQFKILEDNLEYHLLGNHLLENGFSLLFGAYYFKDKDFYRKAKKILKVELEEQILSDGAHFELSPMYHQIIFFRLLDCYNLVKNNATFNKELESLLKVKAEKMLGHLKSISFKNGTIPHLNDATDGIAPTTKYLVDYASRLGIHKNVTPLKECGYRKIETDNYELIVDVGAIGPDYIPGHAHADTFNFVLNINGKPIIVDRGISTYEKNALRQCERVTSSHNTVSINNTSSSDVWSGFRVGKKAVVTILEDSPTKLLANHNGYLNNYKIVHQREFSYRQNSVLIQDNLLANRDEEGTFHLHFNYDVIVRLDKNTIITDFCTINFSNVSSLKLMPYKQAVGFNIVKEAMAIEVIFTNKMQTLIKI